MDKVSCECMCDARNFLGDTLKEQYESVYLKIIEMTNILLAKGADESSLTLTTGRYLGEIIDCNRSWGIQPPQLWERETGRFDMGKLSNRWQWFLDDSISKDTFEVGSSIGKAIMTILNVDKMTN